MGRFGFLEVVEQEDSPKYTSFDSNRLFSTIYRGFTPSRGQVLSQIRFYHWHLAFFPGILRLLFFNTNQQETHDQWWGSPFNTGIPIPLLHILFTALAFMFSSRLVFTHVIVETRRMQSGIIDRPSCALDGCIEQTVDGVRGWVSPSCVSITLRVKPQTDPGLFLKA